MDREQWSPCLTCGKRPHRSWGDAKQAAHNMHSRHRNDQKIWNVYKCRCGAFCTGTNVKRIGRSKYERDTHRQACSEIETWE
jgi:hypothetical protein